METGGNLPRREWLALGALGLSGCAVPSNSDTSRDDNRRSKLRLEPAAAGRASRGRASAKAEFQREFIASGANFRYAPHPAHGRAWSRDLESGYKSFKNDARVGFAVKNLRSGRYLAEHNADEIMMGGSMPKPAVSAIVLERHKGKLSRENFMHIVKVCDKSINASWRALGGLYSIEDERAFFRKYNLPSSRIRGNAQSPRFYCEFFQRCVNYQLDYGNELLLEAMRRAQYGRGRWYLPRSISYIGGKTGTYNEWKHEGLWFNKGGTPYAIVVYTKGHFGRGENYWKMGALFGGLYRQYVA